MRHAAWCVVLSFVLSALLCPNWGFRHTAVPVDSCAKSIVWGEMDSNMLSDMQQVLASVCLPLIKRQNSWGLCSGEDTEQFYSVMDRFLSTLPSSSLLATFRPLEHPDQILIDEIKLSGDVTKEQVSLLEQQLESWMSAIQHVLQNSSIVREDPDEGILDLDLILTISHASITAVCRPTHAV